MKYMMTFVFLTVIAVASPGWAQDWAQKMFAESEHDFGTVARNAKAEHEFTFQNLYGDNVRVAGVRASCGCTSVWVKGDKRELKSWEKGAIVAHINSDLFLGRKGATITVTFDKPYYAEAQLQVRTFIRDDLVLNPGSIQIGSVDQGAPAAAAVAIAAGGSDWRILDVKSSNPHLSTELTEASRNFSGTTYHLTVRLDKATPAGYVRDHVILSTNDPERSQVPVLVEGRVVSSITVGPRMLFLGVVQPGQRVTKQVVVQGKEPFRITQIKAEGEGFEFPATLSDPPKTVHVVPVTFIAGSQPGTVVKTIHVATDLGSATGEFSAQAVVSGKKTAAQRTPDLPQLTGR
jgi:hypothetical protein